MLRISEEPPLKKSRQPEKYEENKTKLHKLLCLSLLVASRSMEFINEPYFSETIAKIALMNLDDITDDKKNGFLEVIQQFYNFMHGKVNFLYLSCWVSWRRILLSRSRFRRPMLRPTSLRIRSSTILYLFLITR